MPDQDLMPRGHVLQPAPRPPAGLGEVLVRATRRRRRQQAGVLATTAAACAAVFAVTMASGSAVDSLGVTPAHPVDRPAPPSVVQHDASVLDAGDGTGSVEASTGGEARSSGPGVHAGAVNGGRPQPAAAVVTSDQPGGEIGPAHSIIRYDASRGCSAQGPTVVMGWCSYYDGALSGRAGQRVELAQALCRAPGQRAGTLHSDDGQQAEFSVIGKDAYTKWTWSKGHRFSKRATTIEVPAGSCVRWHVAWNVLDDGGRALPPGVYDLAANPWMNPPGRTVVNASAEVVNFTVLG